MPKLVFHTYFGEFCGDTPEEIVQQLFVDSRRGIGPDWAMQKWWDYQRTVWKRLEGKKLPASPDELDAAKKMLACLVEVEALEVGPRPSKASG